MKRTPRVSGFGNRGAALCPCFLISGKVLFDSRAQGKGWGLWRGSWQQSQRLLRGLYGVGCIIVREISHGEVVEKFRIRCIAGLHTAQGNAQGGCWITDIRGGARQQALGVVAYLMR